MKSKLFLFAALLSICIAATGWSATWICPDANHRLWSDGNNWNTGVQPGAAEGTNVQTVTSDDDPIIDGTCAATTGTVWMGRANGVDIIAQTGGTYDGGNLIGGQDNGCQTFVNVSNGAWNGAEMWVGNNSACHVEQTGGTITLTAQLFVDRFDKGLGCTVDLLAGTCHIASMHVGSVSTNGSVNIAGGTLTAPLAQTNSITGYYNTGKIVGYGGRGTVTIDTTGATNLVVTATGDPAVLGKAWQPTPADAAIGLAVDAVVSWTAGDYATSHDVYFGTTNPPAFVHNQAATSYDPTGDLAVDTTYYWQINERDAVNVYTGDIWSFATVNPYQASAPSPADGATGVAVDATLSWTKGTTAVSHDVYLGEAADALVLVSDNQAGVTYTPDVLFSGMTYYWRVNEFDGTDEIEGPLWSFSMVASANLTWTDADVNDHLWSSTLNWNNNTLPGKGSSLTLNATANGPELPASVLAYSGIIRFSNSNMTISGGSYRLNGAYLMGQNAGTALLNMTDGVLDTSDDFWGGHRRLSSQHVRRNI